MPPALKSIAALVAAVVMVGGAIAARNALDTKKVRDDLRLTVVCDPLSEAFCQAAAEADPRLTIRVERPDETTAALVALPANEAPGFQAWVTVGPWLQMADGRRVGQPPLEKGVASAASSGLVLVARTGSSLTCDGVRAPAGCLPLPQNPVGLPSPRRNGVGLAGLAQIVLAGTPIAAGELDRNTIESGPAGSVVDAVGRRSNPNAGLEQLNIGFAQANPLVTTQAAAAPAAGRAQVVRSDPPVRAVIQVGVLDSRASGPLGDEPAGQALRKAATDAGWEPGGDLSGGLPEPGVLAALQDAWTGP